MAVALVLLCLLCGLVVTSSRGEHIHMGNSWFGANGQLQKKKVSLGGEEISAAL